MVRHHIEAGAKMQNELVLVRNDFMIVLIVFFFFFINTPLMSTPGRYSVAFTSYRLATAG